MLFLRSWKLIPLIPVGVLLMMMAWARLGGRPDAAAFQSDRLGECPKSPNCVCSLAADEPHAVAPFPLLGSAAESIERLQTVLSAWPRTTIVVATGQYLRAECRSRWIGFVDDVEFLLVDDQIHCRSASRLGYSDLGVNRGRIESLRAAYLNDTVTP